MAIDFLANAGMLVSFISICYQLFRNKGINPTSSIKYRVFLGALMGLLGITLMLFSIHLPNNVVIDLRNLAIILSAFNGGWISAATSFFIIAAFRLMINGINASSIAAITVLALIVVISSIVAKSNLKNSLKWLLSVSISIALSCMAFTVIIHNVVLRDTIILYYSAAISFTAILLYYYIAYSETISTTYRRYKHESKKDFLTGLNNVRQFDNLYNEVTASVTAKQAGVALLYIDIDFFKRVNDTYGHKDGDLVLKKVGEILSAICRNEDIISRNGGEEFSVILTDCPISCAMDIAERIRKAVETASIVLSNQKVINITVSIGVSCYPSPTGNLDELIENADEALYEAKKTGRNKITLYSSK